MHRSIAGTIALLSLLMPGLLPAAPVGAIKGYVRDASGGIVPGAQVTLLTVGTNASTKIVTDENGRFQFLQLNPAEYQISVEAQGFRKTVVQKFTLLVDQIVDQEIKLDLGQVTETVEVKGTGATYIEPERISTGMNIAPSLVKELPISNRNFDSLSLLTPGATPAAAGSQGGNISAAGTRPGSLNSLLDGINNVNRQVGTSINNFRIADAVQEFSVTTTGASADMGRQAGGQVSVVTKSGTNLFHGSAFYFLRNDAFEAANFFANKLGSPKRKLRQNQYGGTVGGPIKKDKLFFFYSWEGLNLNNPAAATSSVVPTLAERAQVVDPIAKKWLDYFPLPNVAGAAPGTANFVANPASTTKDNTHLARVDYMLGSKDRLTGRYVWFGGEVLTAGALVTNGGTSSSPGAQNILFSDTHTFSPTFIADFRIGMSRSVTYLVPQDLGTNAAATFPEIPGLIDSSKVSPLQRTAGHYRHRISRAVRLQHAAEPGDQYLRHGSELHEDQSLRLDQTHLPLWLRSTPRRSQASEQRRRLRLRHDQQLGEFCRNLRHLRRAKPVADFAHPQRNVTRLLVSLPLRNVLSGRHQDQAQPDPEYRLALRVPFRHHGKDESRNEYHRRTRSGARRNQSVARHRSHKDRTRVHHLQDLARHASASRHNQGQEQLRSDRGSCLDA